MISMLFVFASAMTAQAQPAIYNWVARISQSQVQQLAGLNFAEMNIMKNAVMSANGYTYAQDRPWLHAYFHGSWKPSKSCVGDCQYFSLADSEFPMPHAGQTFTLDATQMQAVARTLILG